MNGPWAALILAAFFFALATLCLITAWHHYWPKAEAHLQALISEAIARPIHQRYQDLDEEMRQLVLEEHNNE